MFECTAPNCGQPTLSHYCWQHAVECAGCSDEYGPGELDENGECFMCRKDEGEL